MKVLLENTRAYFNNHPLLKFAWQTIKSMVAIIAICTLLAWVPEQPAERGWLLLWLSPILLCAMVVGLVILGRRYGLTAVASIFAAISILASVQYWVMLKNTGQVEAYALQRQRPIDPDIKVLELTNLANSCKTECIEILMKTHYDVALKDIVYSRAQGDVCRQRENLRSYVQF